MKTNSKLLPIVALLLFPLVQSSCPYLKSDLHEDKKRNLSVLTEVSDILVTLGVSETDIKIFDINGEDGSKVKAGSVSDLEMIEEEQVDVTLTQSDFDSGTFIITKPGRYVLGEDITFAPNSLGEGEVTPQGVLDCCKPLSTQFKSNGGIYDDLNYAIGFTSAIQLESDNIEIDLNGFTIEQSAEHALMMRFFAVIQLNSRIHDEGQGAFFGTIPPGAKILGTSGVVDAGVFLTANNVTIHNGRIGRSSHHGIIGNSNSNVTVRNVEFTDFEVAAMALNGVQGATVENCVAKKNRNDSPVLGLFTHAFFMHRHLQKYESVGQQSTLTIQGQSKTITQVKVELGIAIANVYKDVVRGSGFIRRRSNLAEFRLFDNQARVIDSNIYGFLLNKEGVAVFGLPNIVGDKFNAERVGQFRNPSTNVILNNVKVESLVGNFIETPILNTANLIDEGPDSLVRSLVGVSDANGGSVQLLNRDAQTGELLTISSDSFEEAEYIGTVASNAQFMVSKAQLDGVRDKLSPSDQLRFPLGSIQQQVLEWAEAGGTGKQEAKLSNLLNKLSGGTGQTPFFCNSDLMAHVPKGVNAISLFNVDGAEITDVSVGTIESLAAPNLELCGDYNFTFNNPSATLTGFHGGDVRSFAFAGSKNVKASNLSVGTGGEGQRVTGVHFLTDSRDINVDGVSFTNAVKGRPFLFSPVAVRNSVNRCNGCNSNKPTLFQRIRCGVREGPFSRQNFIGFGCTTLIGDSTKRPKKNSKRPKKGTKRPKKNSKRPKRKGV